MSNYENYQTERSKLLSKPVINPWTNQVEIITASNAFWSILNEQYSPIDQIVSELARREQNFAPGGIKCLFRLLDRIAGRVENEGQKGIFGHCNDNDYYANYQIKIFARFAPDKPKLENEEWFQIRSKILKSLDKISIQGQKVNKFIGLFGDAYVDSVSDY